MGPPGTVSDLVVRVGQIESFDAETEEVSLEYIYSFSLNLRPAGEKRLDGVTRKDLLKQVFLVARDLARPTVTETAQRAAVQTLAEVGRKLFRLVLPAELREDLFGQESPRVVRIESPDHDLPWELLHDGARFICHDFAIARTIAGHSSEVSRRHVSAISIALVVDPSEDLEFARKEGEKLRALFQGELCKLRDRFGFATQLIELQGRQATKQAVFLDLLMGREAALDFMHFASHAVYNRHRPESSGVVLANGELKAFELTEVVAPHVVFVNACRSGVVHNAELVVSYGSLNGLAQAFLKAGTQAYVGTLFPVSDAVALAVAERFYKEILSGQSVGMALLDAKREATDRFPHDPSPLAFLVYGNPDARLRVFAPSLTAGEHVNARGFERIFEIEREYPALELLLVNDLPWILWRDEDFSDWVERIPLGSKQRKEMVKTLIDYRTHFRAEVLGGRKLGVYLVNQSTLERYFARLAPAERSAICDDLGAFVDCETFLLMLYNAGDREVEEIELCSKNRDVFANLNESVYVFNKQSRFDSSPVVFSLFSMNQPEVVRSYANRFFEHFADTLTSYGSTKESLSAALQEGRNLNRLTLDRVRAFGTCL